MAMDFFEHQALARRTTFRLVVLFALAVVAIVATVCLVAGMLLTGAETQAEYDPDVVQPLFDPRLYATVAPVVLGIIGLGSIYKIASLARGGSAVAELMGGQLVNPQTTDLPERKLLNVVEEMAIAAGVPVPPVYVMPGEAGINAFAAGFRPDQAVIGVTRGSIDRLSRDELQGVMAHEFSHILNGDMRLNLRLIGLLHGILVIALVGYYVMRAVGHAPRRSDDDGKGKGGAAAIFIFGIALVVIGYVGVFFGRLIKSAVSRQREFLADASAVQFTRNPDGLAGALKKIGGLAEGSRVRDAHAEEASHMFFGNAVQGAMFAMLSTHPPLAERIRRLEPNWDGKYAKVEGFAPVEEAPQRRDIERPVRVDVVPEGMVAGLAVDSAADLDRLRAKAHARRVETAQAENRVGQPHPPEVDYARVLVPTYPDALRSAADEPHGARAVVAALLLDSRMEVRAKQQAALDRGFDEPTRVELARLAPAVDVLPADARLPLAELCLRSLKSLSPRQFNDFRQVIQTVVQADQQVSLFEYLLWAIVMRSLDVHFAVKKPTGIAYRRVDAIAGFATTVLGMLAQVGHDSPGEAQRAFAAGMAELGLPETAAAPREVSLASFDGALRQLEQSAPELKRKVVAACAACTGADGRATVAESELLRAVCSVLDCPMPPLLPTLGEGLRGEA